MQYYIDLLPDYMEKKKADKKTASDSKKKSDSFDYGSKDDKKSKISAE